MEITHIGLCVQVFDHGNSKLNTIFLYFLIVTLSFVYACKIAVGALLQLESFSLSFYAYLDGVQIL